MNRDRARDGTAAGHALRQAHERVWHADPPLKPLERRVFDAVIDYTISFGRVTDRVFVAQVAAYVYGFGFGGRLPEPEPDPSGKQPRRDWREVETGRVLKRLRERGFVVYEPSRGRGRPSLIGLPRATEKAREVAPTDSRLLDEKARANTPTDSRLLDERESALSRGEGWTLDAEKARVDEAKRRESPPLKGASAPAYDPRPTEREHLPRESIYREKTLARSQKSARAASEDPTALIDSVRMKFVDGQWTEIRS